MLASLPEMLIILAYITTKKTHFFIFGVLLCILESAKNVNQGSNFSKNLVTILRYANHFSMWKNAVRPAMINYVCQTMIGQFLIGIQMHLALPRSSISNKHLLQVVLWAVFRL